MAEEIEFDWDDAKNDWTIAHRGFGFEFITQVFSGFVLQVPDTREDYGEDRFIALGLIGERLHVVAFTMRGDRLRVISLRKANAREVDRYEQAQS